MGAYYYLRVIKLMWFDAPAERQPLQAPWDVRGVLTINGIAVLALGVLPGGLMEICKQAIVGSLAG